MEEFSKSAKHLIHFLNSFLTKENISENDILLSVKELCVFWIDNENIHSENISIRISRIYQIAERKAIPKVPFWVTLSLNVFGYIAQERNQTDQFKEEIREIRNEVSNLEFLSKWES